MLCRTTAQITAAQHVITSSPSRVRDSTRGSRLALQARGGRLLTRLEAALQGAVCTP